MKIIMMYNFLFFYFLSAFCKLRYGVQVVICVIFFHFICLQVGAQNDIKGVVINVHQEIVPNANLLLYNLNDTTHIVKTSISDGNGRFTFLNIPVGNYKLVVSNIQYENAVIYINNFLENIRRLKIVMNDRIESLKEITIEADHTIRKFDKQILFPNEFEKTNSINGIEFLEKLNLNGVVVSKLDNSVKGVLGGTVQLRINGALADISAVRAIDPKLIRRIEYHDMPSMRYGDVEAVVDLYVKHRESGGRVDVFALNGISSKTGTGTVNVKANYKKSEFSISGGYSYAKFYKKYSMINEIFNFEDGTQLTRFSEGIPSCSRERTYQTRLGYSYFGSNNDLFMAKLSYDFFEIPEELGRSHVFLNSHSDGIINKENLNSYSDKKPSLNLYYQKNIKKNQFLAIDVVGTHIGVNSFNSYLESQGDNMITDILTTIDGNKYSIIVGGIYENKMKKGKMSIGLNQNLNFADNTYEDVSENKTKVDQYITNAYFEWSANLNKFFYAGGLGGVWTKKVIQKGDKDSYFRFRPLVRLGYRFKDNILLRYQGSIEVQTPVLGNINDAQISKDGYNILRGNPDLKPVLNYNNSLMLTYDKGDFSSSININYTYNDHPMLRSISREDNKFVTQVQNGKNGQRISLSGSLRWSAFKRRLNVYSRFGYRYSYNAHKDYSHSLNTWYISAGVNGTYKNITLSTSIDKEADLLLGERITYRGQSLYVGLDYKWKNLKVGSDFIWRLRPYLNRTVDLNPYASSDTYIYVSDTQPLFRVKLSWNLDFGRQKSGSYKRINNTDEDSGILN